MPHRRSILIIANPTSGRGRGRRMAETVAGALRESDLEVSIRFTAAGGQAEGIADRACRESQDRPDCIVACGGDGTVQEIANALARNRTALGDRCPALGLLPAGRCNDFARALGIDKHTDGIIRTLRSGVARPIDLGRVNDRYFCTVATLGVDAEVSSFVDTMRMPLAGTTAYLYGALRVLMRYRPQTVRLNGDFPPITQPVFLASCANTSSYGGAIRIAPDADPTDGRLDLCLIDSVSRIRSLTLLPTVLAGRHAQLPEVRFISTTGYRLETDHPMDIWADGERITQTPAKVEAVPRALRVLTPPKTMPPLSFERV